MGTPIYLVHVLFDDWREVGAWFVVAKEGTLESLLIQEIHWVGFERIIFVRHTNKHSNTPSVMDAFKCRNHGIDAPGTLDTSINSSTGHFSYDLRTVNQNEDRLIGLADASRSKHHSPCHLPLVQACRNLLGSQTRWRQISWLLKEHKWPSEMQLLSPRINIKAT